MLEEAVEQRETEVVSLLADPSAFFGLSFTEMQSIPRERMVALQREGLARRFAQLRDRVPMLAKLAERQGITSVEELEDVVPLLFEHTMYKSYPQSLLERGQFDKITGWLDKLTAVDLSGVDATSCEGIDAWTDLLTEAGLDVAFSSGTSGTMSFIPWAIEDLEVKHRAFRLTANQTFGVPPTHEDMREPIHALISTIRHRRDFMGDAMGLGHEGYSHLRVADRLSADLLWLASRLRLAAARGDVDRVQVPPALLARRGELEDAQRAEPAREQAWVQTIRDQRSHRVFWMSHPYDIHHLAVTHVGDGEPWAFTSDSSLLVLGGPKGKQLPPDWKAIVQRSFDIPLRQGYGMVEISCWALECDHGRLHLAPWIIPFILDPATSELLPRSGVQRGRLAFFDLLPQNHWSGLMTGDDIEVDFDGQCGCGATTHHISPVIARLSESRGGDDKISCAASPEAHAEAMDFLVGY